MFGVTLLFATAMLAPQDMCPTLNTSSFPTAKGKATYTLSLSGGDPKATPSYNWTISNGTIASGQGTPTILVEADPGAFVTATVDVGGYARSCATSDSSSTETGTEDPAPAAAAKCPVLGVEGGRTAKGETIFKATADPIPSGDFTFSWSVSAGSISAGQGTGNILVEGPKGTSVTATMDVGGLPPECGRTASGTMAIQ